MGRNTGTLEGTGPGTGTGAIQVHHESLLLHLGSRLIGVSTQNYLSDVENLYVYILLQGPVDPPGRSSCWRFCQKVNFPMRHAMC